MSSIDWVGLTQNANVHAQIEEGKALAKSGNILAALALIMGAMAQGKIDNITKLAEKIDNQKTTGPGGTPQAGPNETTLNAAMQAEIQLMSMLISSMTNSLKTYGESVREVARK